MMTRPHWPAGDRASWSDALRDGALFDAAGPASRWSEASRKAVAYDYSRWLGFLRDSDPEALALDLADRVTPMRVAAYSETLEQQVGSVSHFSYLIHLYDAVRVMAPDRDWDWLKGIARRLEIRMVPRPKRHLVVFSDRLLDLGVAMMDAADLATRPGALQYRDGLIIAMLAMRPIRRRNLAMIRIGRHLQEAGDGYRLVFEACETKTHRALEYRVPTCLDRYMKRYLTMVRPRFYKADLHDGLWASCKGRPMTGEAIYERVCTHTQAAFGHAINPHLFRDCIATTIADRAPDQVLEVAGILGHNDYRTVERHYNQAGMMDAAKRAQASIRSLAEELRGHSMGFVESKR